MKPTPGLLVVLLGALLGLVFAGVSTYDFVEHLDRQVHTLHCSFIPGLTHTGESGCQVAMMSPYSSMFRSHVWGGIPISLAAMSVFAFIGFFTIDLLLTRRKHDRRATGFLALAAALPAITSIVMLTIALTKLGTTCKLCIGIYAASALCLAGAIVAWRAAARTGVSVPRAVARDRRPPDRASEPAFTSTDTVASAKDSGSRARLLEVSLDASPASTGFLAGAFAIGVVFVAVPVLLYLAVAPDHTHFIGTCDGVAKPDDTYNVMVQIGPTGGAPTIEVLDPLCPACRAFEDRLAASGMEDRLDRKAILFPLDNTCNWMVTETTHPGACVISEAVLCAGKRANEVIQWAFDQQDTIRDDTRARPEAALEAVKKRFPDLASCVGSPEAKARLNKSLRWSVTNSIRVLTPQLFIDGVKLCDEDVDLGLEYTLSNMLDRHDHHTLVKQTAEKAP